MPKQNTITKSTTELYKIRTVNGAWADIVIDANGNTGRIQIASDFGSWDYYWGACGNPFKKFLTELDKHYAAGKFGEDRWFDLDDTIELLNDQIKDYTNDKLLIIELKEEIKELANTSCKEEFIVTAARCENVMDMTNHCPDLCTSISPSFEQFWNKLWPTLIEQLKKEITQTT